MLNDESYKVRYRISKQLFSLAQRGNTLKKRFCITKNYKKTLVFTDVARTLIKKSWKRCSCLFLNTCNVNGPQVIQKSIKLVTFALRREIMWFFEVAQAWRNKLTRGWVCPGQLGLNSTICVLSWSFPFGSCSLLRLWLRCNWISFRLRVYYDTGSQIQFSTKNVWSDCFRWGDKIKFPCSRHLSRQVKGSGVVKG